VSPRTLRIFFHDSCFDGATSAALFGAYYQDVHPGAEIKLRGVQHRRGDPFEGARFDGDDNACVDFRYSADPRLTWWFDHHVSAFQPPELRAHFEADTSGQKFFDPEAQSCSIFIERVLGERFGWRPADPGGHWAELVHWANLIDGAKFPSPAVAVELAEPALRIMTWLESNHDPALTKQLIRALGRRSLAELAAEPFIAEALAPRLVEHRRHIELIAQRARYDGGVIFFDLADDGVAAHNKFIPYTLHPDAAYTVGVTRGADRAKISVGSNPWRPELRRHDIAAICERYGGGGHPVVGAVSLPPEELARARQIADLIRRELAGPGDSLPQPAGTK
jgi:hypothetical protein